MTTTEYQLPLQQSESHPVPKAAPQIFPSITAETRSHVETACAAFWMNRKPQTMRAWACFEDGPLRPTRVNGRLAWAVADIRRLLAEGSR